jgi:hypothetical protein
VILYKKLKATFKNELPAEQGLLLDQTRSRRDVGWCRWQLSMKSYREELGGPIGATDF